MAHLPDPGDVFDTNPDTPDGRPTSVLAIAALGVIFGAVGILVLPWGLAPFFATAAWPPLYVEGNPVLSRWVVAASLFGTALSALLLVGSTGCFSLKNWGRIVMLLYGVLSVLFGIVGAFFYFRWLVPAMRQSLTGVRDVGPLGGFAAWVIGSLFAVAVLYVMTRPHVKAVFTHWRPEAEDESGGEAGD